MARGTVLAGLWRQPEFLKLWAGQTISLIGTQITVLALPLTAALVLDASPLQMGLLSALEFTPFLVIGLLVGAWVDRLRRRPILVAANAGRALLLGSIPLAAAIDGLRIEQLYLVALGVGTLTVFFDVAYQSFLPALVSREQLVEGNSKLEMSRAVAQTAGPGLGGLLVQALTAPVAIVVDALSYLGSVVFLLLIRTPEPPPASRAQRHLWHEVGEGLRFVARQPLLRAIAGCTAVSNLAGNLIFAVFVLYTTRELRLSPAALGVVFAAAGPGALAGAALAGRAARRLGLGPTLIGSTVTAAAAWSLIIIAAGPPTVVVTMLVVARVVAAVGWTMYNVTILSLRQAITPDHLLGRVNATMRVLMWGTIPLGFLLGGVLGETIGLRPTIALGVVGTFGVPLWLLLSPVRRVHERPTLIAEPATS